MACGVYRIFNSISLKSYVGSSIDIEDRWLRHKKDLRAGCHHSIKLQRSWDLHGFEAFIFEILVECPREQLDWQEALFQAKFNCIEDGYNLVALSLENGLVLRGHSEETKLKLAKANLGKTFTMERCANISKALTGRITSEEQKNSISEALQGRVITWGDKISKAMKGKKFSEEHRKKLSEAAQNRKRKETNVF